MKKSLYIIVLAIFILAGCAKPTDPYSKETETKTSFLEIDMVFPTIGRPYSIDVTEQYVVIAEDQAGFSVYDRISGELYSRVTEYNEGWSLTENIRYAKYLEIGESKIIYALERFGYSAGLIVFNARDPYNIEGDTTIIGSNIGFSNYMRIFLDESSQINIFYTMGFTGYRNFNYGTLSGPFHTMLNIETGILPNTLRGFDTRDNIAFIAGEQRGLYIFDMNSNSLVSELNLPGEALDVRIKEDFAYVVCKQEGIQVVNITDLTNPYLVDSYDTVGWALHLDINGDFVAVASGSGGAYLFKIMEDGLLYFIDGLSSDVVDYTYRVAIDDNQLYVAGRYKGITRANITY